jgi:hypothetical protein
MAVGDFKWMGFVNKLEYNWPHLYFGNIGCSLGIQVRRCMKMGPSLLTHEIGSKIPIINPQSTNPCHEGN